MRDFHNSLSPEQAETFTPVEPEFTTIYSPNGIDVVSSTPEMRAEDGVGVHPVYSLIKKMPPGPSLESPSGRTPNQSMDFDLGAAAVREIGHSIETLAEINSLIRNAVSKLMENEWKGTAGNGYHLAYRRWMEGYLIIMDNLKWLAGRMDETVEKSQETEASLVQANDSFEAPPQPVY